MRKAVLAAIAITGGISIAVSAQQNVNMDDVVVRAVEVSPGVAVLFGNGGNIAVGYGEDGTLLVDDQFAELSDKINAAIGGLGADRARFLVNTHWHFDHAGGNVNFGEAGTTIVAQDNVRRRLLSGGSIMGREFPPEPKAGLPVVTYESGLSFHLNGDEIDVYFFGGGHTDGDSVVHWRKANVIHTGDMFVKDWGYPLIDLDSGGDVLHLLGSLGRIIALADDDTVIVPGHGPLATRGDVVAFRAMVQTAVDRVRALKESGKSFEEAKASRPLAGVRNVEGWITDDQFFEFTWKSLEKHRQ